MEECPICFDTYHEENRYTCNLCRTSMCVVCIQNLWKEECPFCRVNLSTSLPPPSAAPIEHRMPPLLRDHHHLHDDDNHIMMMSQSLPTFFYPNPVPYWENSRTINRQLRRERRRQEHENQQLRNAELSRIHNIERRNNHNRASRSRQERRNELLMFDIDID